MSQANEEVDFDAWPDEGPWEVRLLIPVDTAESPEGAVEEFIYDITNYGLRTYMYRVTHVPTQKSFYVQQGETLSESDAIARAEEYAAVDTDEEGE